MGREANDPYDRPLERRLEETERRLDGTRVLDDLRAELAANHAWDGLLSFEMFMLRKP